jgi:hypothetical protein
MEPRPRSLFLAALLALGAAPCAAQDDQLQAQVQRALAAARPALQQHLKAATRRTPRPGELALLCLAGIHDGMATDEPPLKKALAQLWKGRPDQTYDLALRLLVLEACTDFAGRERLAKKDLAGLLAHRSRQGAFQYHERPSTWDLSNTQYGALGLRAAASIGLKVRASIWSKLGREVADQQSSDGGFGYVPKRAGLDAYPSMTAAGIAVLAICRQALGGEGKLCQQLDQQLAGAWEWMDAHRDAIGSSKTRWSYYFHYGLERAAILCDVTKIAGRTDWYALGAQMLVDEQLSGGGWTSTQDGFPGSRLADKRGDSVPTAFAVLFLRRKFQKHVGPVTERVVRLVNIGPRSKQADVDECARQLARRGVAAMPAVTRAMRSDVLPQRQVAAQALQVIVGERLGFDPAASRDDNRAAVRRAELWYLKRR